jgi:hypothetical protein
MIRAGRCSRSAMIRLSSSWMLVFASPKLANNARLPPVANQGTIARACGRSRSLTWSGSSSKPNRGAVATLAARKAR